MIQDSHFTFASSASVPSTTYVILEASSQEYSATGVHALLELQSLLTLKFSVVPISDVPPLLNIKNLCNEPVDEVEVAIPILAISFSPLYFALATKMTSHIVSSNEEAVTVTSKVYLSPFCCQLPVEILNEDEISFLVLLSTI